MQSGRVVVITGANGQVGRALLQRLQQTGAYTIALTRQATLLPADRLVAGPLDDLPAMAAIQEADIVVHLAGALCPGPGNPYRNANVGTAEAVASALPGGKARRILFLSYVGASQTSRNLYLRTKAEAEQILHANGSEVVVFRCTDIIGSPDAPGPTAQALIARSGKPARVLGRGRQIVAPVYRGDVVSALLAAMIRGTPGTYDLAGPDQMSMDELVRLLNQNPEVPIAHIPDWLARLVSGFVPALPGPMVDLLMRDSVGDSASAVETFGLQLTPLRRVWTQVCSDSGIGDPPNVPTHPKWDAEELDEHQHGTQDRAA